MESAVNTPYKITFFKKDYKGWTFNELKTTKEKLNQQMTSLNRQEKEGTIRMLDVVDLER